MTIAHSRMMARLYGARLALTLSCLLALFTVSLCYSLEWRGPFRDLWEFIWLIREQFDQQWNLAPLIEPYGGIHRIFGPKILFFLDYRYAYGSNLLALTTTLAFHVAATGLLLYSVYRLDVMDKADKLILAAIVIACFFSTTQIYNLIYISDNQVPLSNALAILAAWLVIVAIEQQKTHLIYLANLFIGFASLCHSSGLMLWPALILVLWLSGQTRRLLFGQCAMAAIVFGLYLSGNDPLDKQQSSVLEQLSSLLSAIALNTGGILRYTGLHLSSPLSREWPMTGITLSYLSISYLGWRLWVFGRSTMRETSLTKLMVLLAMYGIMIAAVTALGRQMYPNSALTDRYQTLVMTYWAAMLCLLYIDLRKQSEIRALFAPVLTALLLIPWQYQNAEQMQWLSSRVRIAHTAAIAGVTDIESIAATLSHPLLMDKKNLVAEHNNWLREKQLGYFSEPLASYFHGSDPATFNDSLQANRCSGNLVSAEPVTLTPAAYRLVGTGQVDGNAVREILILGPDNQVAGLGYTHRERGDFMPHQFRDSTSTTWIGFIKTTHPPDTSYVVIGRVDSGFCRLFETRL